MAREQGTTRREYLRLAAVGGAAGLPGCSDLDSALGGDDNASTDDDGGLFGTRRPRRTPGPRPERARRQRPRR